jgi:hypothetical protein
MVSEERERERVADFSYKKDSSLHATRRGRGRWRGRESFGKCFLNSNENNVIEGLLNDLAGDLSHA